MFDLSHWYHSGQAARLAALRAGSMAEKTNTNATQSSFWFTNLESDWEPQQGVRVDEGSGVGEVEAAGGPAVEVFARLAGQRAQGDTQAVRGKVWRRGQGVRALGDLGCRVSLHPSGETQNQGFA